MVKTPGLPALGGWVPHVPPQGRRPALTSEACAVWELKAWPLHPADWELPKIGALIRYIVYDTEYMVYGTEYMVNGVSNK